MAKYHAGFAGMALCLGAFTMAANAQTLTIGQIYVPNSVDPHFYNGTPTKTLSEHIFDRLFEQAPDTTLKPGLAVSWKPIADTVWEVKLRPGVTFTNGAPFTADDVQFSYGRALNVPNTTGGFAGVLRAVQRVEIVDPLTVRIHTPAPAPTLPNDLANVAIISRAVGTGAATEDYNAGRAAIGTGPFRMIRFSPGDGVELERNENWWGDKPDWQRVSVKFIPNSAARTAALLSGGVDMIDQPPPNDLPRLQSDPRFVVATAIGARAVYLSPDQFHEGPSPFVTDNDGRPLPRNPLRDQRVREALSVALNRTALSERILQGTGTPTGQFMPPGAYSYHPDIPVPAFDPERSRKLLAEAGYPQGFRVTIHAPTDVRPTDPIIAQAIAQMWSRVGVQTAVETIPNAVFATRATRREISVGLWSWGSNSGEAGFALVNVFNTDSRERRTGTYNRAGYSSAELDALTDRAMTTLDDGAREVLLRQATAKVMGDVAVIPLYQVTNYWATRKGITYQPSAHDRTLAMLARLDR